MANVRIFTNRKAIEQEAREWLIRLDSDDEPSQVDIDALREWVDRSPVHREELLRLSAFWNEANILTELSIPLHSKTGKQSSQIQPGIFSALLSPILSFKGVSAVVGVCFLTIGAAMTIWFNPSPTTTSNGIYATAIGEVRLQMLADDSVIQINTDSQVQVDYSDKLRKLRLFRGEVHFDVASDLNWPFEVYVGKSRIKAVGTAFSVRLNRDKVKVTVSEGRVDLAAWVERPVTTQGGGLANNEVDASVGNTPVRYEPILEKIGSLGYGQSAILNSQALSVPQGLVSNEPEQNIIEEITILAEQELARQLSWREGYLVFAGDPLSHVVNEVNRYTPVTIDIADPALRQLRIGGRFKVGELDAMFDVLENSFGIQVTRLDDQHIRLSPAQ